LNIVTMKECDYHILTDLMRCDPRQHMVERRWTKREKKSQKKNT
jgi:hypothetical protein